VPPSGVKTATAWLQALGPKGAFRSERSRCKKPPVRMRDLEGFFSARCAITHATSGSFGGESVAEIPELEVFVRLRLEASIFRYGRSDVAGYTCAIVQTC
jgi:hypothetical protein